MNITSNHKKWISVISLGFLSILTLIPDKIPAMLTNPMLIKGVAVAGIIAAYWIANSETR